MSLSLSLSLSLSFSLSLACSCSLCLWLYFCFACMSCVFFFFFTFALDSCGYRPPQSMIFLEPQSEANKDHTKDKRKTRDNDTPQKRSLLSQSEDNRDHTKDKRKTIDNDTYAHREKIRRPYKRQAKDIDVLMTKNKQGFRVREFFFLVWRVNGVLHMGFSVYGELTAFFIWDFLYVELTAFFICDFLYGELTAFFIWVFVCVSQHRRGHGHMFLQSKRIGTVLPCRTFHWGSLCVQREGPFPTLQVFVCVCVFTSEG